MPWRSSSRWTWTAPLAVLIPSPHFSALFPKGRVMRGLLDDGLLKFIKNHISLTSVKIESGLTIPPYEASCMRGQNKC